MNIRTVLILFLYGTIGPIWGQWTWTALAPLPVPSANNAVCSAWLDDGWKAYSFGGITTGLSNADIHRSCFRFDVADNVWVALPDLPDSLGKIASAASVVGDTAYVIGGYHVFNGPPYELSSNKVHRLNLTTDLWLDDGASIPVPIDDQVQAVWRDSLIYVITGWSNSTNVANVQVYDPAHDTWSLGTSVPNNNLYKAFGASGIIIGDTIYYYGGASTATNFPAQDKLRVGIIDPANPLNIAWQLVNSGPTGARYRSGALNYNGAAAWIGGSSVSYNYDAIAYNGSGVVDPITEVPVWTSVGWSTAGNTPYRKMDLRGLAELDGGRFILVGGIGIQQHVLDSVHFVEYPATGIPSRSLTRTVGYPNPAVDRYTVQVPAELLTCQYEISDARGSMLRSGTHHGKTMVIDVSDLATGQYVLRLRNGSVTHFSRFGTIKGAL